MTNLASPRPTSPWHPDYAAVSIRLASPETIRSWSHGEVRQMVTLNANDLKAQPGGLFCEQIFGPTRDWTCSCGKYAGIAHQSTVCEICGVQITLSRVRGKRMGHIELASPVVHTWFITGEHAHLAILLGIAASDLQEVIYFRKHLVLDPGTAPLRAMDLLTEEQLRTAVALHGDAFTALTGAAAVKELLRRLDLAKLNADLRRELAAPSAAQDRARITRRLAMAEDLQSSGNDPQWMVMTVIPVIPPALRPLIPLDNGNFLTSDLNELYRVVIFRNNKLRKLIELNAPAVIIHGEQCALQKAVDALFDNDHCRPSVIDEGRRLLSLTDMIHGRRGRFRENLRGKRTDFSACAVVVPDPGLALDQCGLPEAIICELFQPFIIRLLVERGHAASLAAGKHLLDQRDDAVWEVIDEAIEEKVVLLNRIPTLYRHGVLAFAPVRVAGHAIHLHPLLGKRFRIHFAGERMAVHLPLSSEAQREARDLVLATANFFSQADGHPAIAVSSSIVLGCAFLTLARAGQPGEGTRFSDINEVRIALEAGAIGIHALIRMRLPAGTRIADSNPDVWTVTTLPATTLVDTTPGRLLFHETLPADLPFFNRQQDKRSLRQMITNAGNHSGRAGVGPLLDALARLGFTYATRSGLSLASADCSAPAELPGILAQADIRIAKFDKALRRGLITEQETSRNVIEVWTYTAEAISSVIADRLKREQPGTSDLDPLALMNPALSGASRRNLRFILGMRGLMAKPGGEIITTPVRAGFRAGLSPSDYHTLARGTRVKPIEHARKLTATRSLTRALMAVAHAVMVRGHDCGTADGITKIISTRFDNLTGRIARDPIVDPITAAVIVAANDLITRAHAESIAAAGITSVRVRSPVTCAATRGICRLCYGGDPGRGRLVDLGAAVGVVAALALAAIAARTLTQVRRRFFICGYGPPAMEGEESESSLRLAPSGPLPRLREILEARPPKDPAILAEISGTVDFGERRRGRRTMLIRSDLPDASGHLADHPSCTTVEQAIPPGKHYRVHKNDRVQAGDPLVDGDPILQDLLRLKGEAGVLAYILMEISGFYRVQGVPIDDRHIETIVRQMLSMVAIADPGDLPHRPGQLVHKSRIRSENRDAQAAGRRPATVTPTVMGITTAARHTQSFIAAAALLDTRQVLADAALAGRRDPLAGLQENQILGHLVPCGTGYAAAQTHDHPAH